MSLRKERPLLYKIDIYTFNTSTVDVLLGYLGFLSGFKSEAAEGKFMFSNVDSLNLYFLKLFFDN